MAASSSIHQLSIPKHPRLLHSTRLHPPLPQLTPVRSPSWATIRATSAVAVVPELSAQKIQTSEAELLSCPICFEPLIRRGPSGFNWQAIYRSGFKCKKCNRSYSSKENFLDLTLSSGMKDYVEVKPAGTELFRSPVVSWLYERGWRQNFNRSGFPGPDEEFKMAHEYFKPAEGGLLVDVSCGSGLFSRKFAKSGTYSKVIALDFSENMLRQCYDFIKQDPALLEANLALVRADVSRLPFASGSVDAIHAGAALHCWPSPSNAVGFSLPFDVQCFLELYYFAPSLDILIIEAENPISPILENLIYVDGMCVPNHGMCRVMLYSIGSRNLPKNANGSHSWIHLKYSYRNGKLDYTHDGSSILAMYCHFSQSSVGRITVIYLNVFP